MFHHLLPHWMDLSTWEDLWTSFAITSIFTIPALVVSHVKLHRKINKSRARMEDLMDPNTPGGLGDIKIGTQNE